MKKVYVILLILFLFCQIDFVSLMPPQPDTNIPIDVAGAVPDVHIIKGDWHRFKLESPFEMIKDKLYHLDDVYRQPLKRAEAGIVFGSVIAAPASAPAGDGLIGDSSTGGFDYAAEEDFIYTVYQPDDDGNVSFGHIYAGYLDNKETTASLCNASGTVLAYGSITDPDTNDSMWHNFALNTTAEVSLATNYICGIQVNSASSWRHWTISGGNDVMQIAVAYSSTPSSFNVGSATTRNSGYNLKIIFNNSSGDPS